MAEKVNDDGAPPENLNTVTEEEDGPQHSQSTELPNLDMREQDAEEDYKHQLKEETEQVLEPAAESAVSSDIKMEDDVRQNVQNEGGGSEAHPSPVPELVSSDLDMQKQDAEDDGPPPGWDNNKHQVKEETEPVLEPAAVSAVSSDIKTGDVRKNVLSEGGGSGVHPSPVPELVSSDITVDHQDSEEEGPPPGWDSKSQSEPKLQVELPSTPPSGHMEADDVQKDAQNEDDLLQQLQAHTSKLYELIGSDIQVEQDDTEDEGPPPGWDSKSESEPKLQVELSSTSLSGHMEAEDVHKDAQDDDHLPPQSQAHTSQLSALVVSDMQVEQHDSEDEGPPPGWDSKCQPQPESQLAHPTTPQSDIKMIDAQQDAQNEESAEPRSQAHPTTPPEVVPSDIKMDQQDSEDEGPPPGWDSKCQPGSNPTTPRSEFTKTEDIQQVQNENAHQPQSLADPAAATEPVPSDTQVEQQDSEDDGPPPGWDSKCESEPKVQEACPSNPQSDTKTGDVQLSVQNKDGPEPQPLSRSIPAPELVISDTNVEEQDSEDEGPPPGWDSKCQPESKSQRPCSSDSKMEDDQRVTHDDEGPPPGWESTPQQELQAHISLPSPRVQSGGRMDCEQNNVKAVKEIPRPPSRQRSITPSEPQAAMSKRPRSIDRCTTPIEPQIPMPKRQRSSDNFEMGQMVCGSCRLLLSYPRGARYVECACCLEENYVLEEHEVGQVVCGSCDVLLMYPYGAPKVKCANCKVETEIGDKNRRPPLSEHKKRARQHLRRVQAG